MFHIVTGSLFLLHTDAGMAWECPSLAQIFMLKKAGIIICKYFNTITPA
jgi:hypothetical protein